MELPATGCGYTTTDTLRGRERHKGSIAMKTMLLGACAVATLLASAAMPVFAQDASKPAAPPAPETKPVDPDAALNAMVGRPAPAFTLPDQNDKSVSLADSK